MQAVFFEGNRTFRVGESVAVEPEPGQVQIRVAFCGICGTDLHLFHGAMAHRLTPAARHGARDVGHHRSAWAAGVDRLAARATA